MIQGQHNFLKKRNNSNKSQKGNRTAIFPSVLYIASGDLFVFVFRFFYKYQNV